jgi:hypothetical protein
MSGYDPVSDGKKYADAGELMTVFTSLLWSQSW